MVFTISLNNVLIFILFVAGITLLVYLIITVNRINNIIKDVEYIFNKNRSNIDNTISLLPGIASNIQVITEEVKEGVQTITFTAETIEKNIGKSSGIIAEKTQVALDYVQILSEIIKAGINYLSKHK